MAINEQVDVREGLAHSPFPDMVWIPGGTFHMGSEHHYLEERPVHRATVDGFWMDRAPVTNERFARFIEETGHRTFAEIPPDPEQYPGALPEMLYAGSLVFVKPDRRPDPREGVTWWTLRAWGGLAPSARSRKLYRAPKTSSGRARDICRRRGVRAMGRQSLPTEAEWEFAARGGIDGAAYAWGDEFLAGHRHLANTWQGEFPWQSFVQDGFEGTSPVGAFPPNGYGLVDMIGNVWEWTSDWYVPNHPQEAAKACCIPRNPLGPRLEHSYDRHSRRSRFREKCSKADRTCARRTIAGAIVRRRGFRSPSIHRHVTWDFGASCAPPRAELCRPGPSRDMS